MNAFLNAIDKLNETQTKILDNILPEKQYYTPVKRMIDTQAQLLKNSYKFFEDSYYTIVGAK
jgi:hypothetical protein